VGVPSLKKDELTITIFGSSRPQPGEKEYLLAYEVGRSLATAGFTICNGGYAGTMEASAAGAHSAQGHTIGVTTEFFHNSRPNQWIREVVTTPTIVERLLELIHRADAFVILKGGTGTLLEMAAVWEFVNKRVIPYAPIIIVGDFWSAVIETLKGELRREGFSTDLVQRVQTAEECADLLTQLLRKPIS
jgi:uncharacterized protein (TIGR00730 family)